MTRRALLAVTLLFAFSAAAQQRWWFFFEETDAAALVQKLSKENKARTAAIVDVNLISMAGTPRVEAHQTVLVEDGRIARIGPAAEVPVPRGALRIDGRGRYLIPGLTDAHVHTLESSNDYLLQLMHGVTTVREMCGFPWLLRIRDAARANRLAVPLPYVASHILNGFPMGIYTTVVQTPEEAARAVREQKRAGYAYIKTHNALARDVYQAILDTAKEENIRVVGHVPVRASISMAIAGGHFTLEHFKGYYLDNNLTLSTEDWITPTKGADIWLCPTFYNRHPALTEAETRQLVASPLGKLVSPRIRARWIERSKEPDPSSVKVWALSQEIFPKLLPVTDRWIAGTDSGGGYRNMIPGHALIDEVETFERLGMKPVDALKTATSNAAAALLDPHSFGTIEAGKRADLVLLDRNPLETAKNLRDPRGVMLRGIWLDPRAIRASVEALHAHSGPDAPSNAQVDALLKRMQVLRDGGWIYRDEQLDELAELLRVRNRAADADRIASWRTAAR